MNYLFLKKQTEMNCIAAHTYNSGGYQRLTNKYNRSGIKPEYMEFC